MRSRPGERSGRTVAGTSIALAVLVCAWSSKAEAGCSHYQIATSNSGHVTQRLHILELGAATVVSSEAPARQKPCSGALCSGKPAVPVPIPVSIVVNRSEEALVPRLPASPSPSTLCRLLAYEERLVRSVIEGPSIDRPPR